MKHCEERDTSLNGHRTAMSNCVEKISDGLKDTRFSGKLYDSHSIILGPFCLLSTLLPLVRHQGYNHSSTTYLRRLRDFWAGKDCTTCSRTQWPFDVYLRDQRDSSAMACIMEVSSDLRPVRCCEIWTLASGIQLVDIADRSSISSLVP